MKAFLVPVLLCGAALLTGCETVAVVDGGPHYYSPGSVYYESGRPYYYTSGVRYWGYPRGYSGHRSYTHVDVDRDVTRNYYVDRRTVYRGGQAQAHHQYRKPHVGGTTNIKAQPQSKQKTVKKKKVVVQERDNA